MLCRLQATSIIRQFLKTMRSIHFLCGLVLGAGLWLGGCNMVPQSDDTGSGGGLFSRSTASEGERLTAERLHNGLMCGPDLQQATALWIDDAADLATRFQRMSGAASDPPVVDFEHHGVLLITMGEQPTAGYRLNFLPERHRVELRGRTLRVDLAWETPPPESMQAQVLTHPCMLLQLPRRSFNRVRVIDQEGTVRVSVARSGSRTAGS